MNSTIKAPDNDEIVVWYVGVAVDSKIGVDFYCLV
jgi:hypothetical protein